MSLITELPAIFDSFSDARRQGFLAVMALKERQIPLVGTYCTFMPQEVAMAAGAVVVSLCSTSDETIEEAERVFAALSAGGNVQMPLTETFWSHRFGMFEDRYGKPWMVNCNKPMPTEQDSNS